MGSMFNNKNEMENPGMSDGQRVLELDYASVFRSITDFHLILNPRIKSTKLASLMTCLISYAVLTKHSKKT